MTTIAGMFDQVVVTRTLPEPTRSWALVGCYMGYFAHLERAIESGIENILDVDGMAVAALMRNMGMQAKISSLRVLVNLLMKEEDCTRLDQLLVRAADAAADRNIIAHNVFGGSDDGTSIEFYSVDARKRLSFKGRVWTIAQFESKIDALRETADGLTDGTAKQAFAFARVLLKGKESDPGSIQQLTELLSGSSFGK